MKVKVFFNSSFGKFRLKDQEIKIDKSFNHILETYSKTESHPEIEICVESTIKDDNWLSNDDVTYIDLYDGIIQDLRDCLVNNEISDNKHQVDIDTLKIDSVDLYEGPTINMIKINWTFECEDNHGKYRRFAVGSKYPLMEKLPKKLSEKRMFVVTMYNKFSPCW